MNAAARHYSVLDLEGGDRVNEVTSEFPPPDVTYVKYYLDARTRTLDIQAPAEAAKAAYNAEANPVKSSMSRSICPPSAWCSTRASSCDWSAARTTRWRRGGHCRGHIQRQRHCRGHAKDIRGRREDY